jgi:hypothetical protein
MMLGHYCRRWRLDNALSEGISVTGETSIKVIGSSGNPLQ